jgi:osmotically-inducible protein OsmY
MRQIICQRSVFRLQKVNVPADAGVEQFGILLCAASPQFLALRRMLFFGRANAHISALRNDIAAGFILTDISAGTSPSVKSEGPESNRRVPMKSDSDLERDVWEELLWIPNQGSDEILVSAKNGVVALTGFVHSFLAKYEAEKAVKRVAGVVGVVNDIEVRLHSQDERSDVEIAREAVAAIKSVLPYFCESIKVIVRNGWITLEGEVEWNYQKEAAEYVVRHVKGLKGVTNLVKTKPRIEPSELKRKIEEALKRNAAIDAQQINVEAHGGDVVLTGRVRSWVEREEAERAAWAAPGVVKVDDRIAVSAS